MSSHGMQEEGARKNCLNYVVCKLFGFWSLFAITTLGLNVIDLLRELLLLILVETCL